jgi:hypothetical protein
MLIQGSNNPLVIQFDAAVDTLPKLVITLWSDTPGNIGKPLKTWEREDMTISGDTAICPIGELETKEYYGDFLILEAKGLDGDGNTIFWDEYSIDLKHRRD